MKFNLKNRPTPVVSYVPERQERFITTETKEWFEGFEKELRDRLEQAKKFENDNNQDKFWRLKSIGFQDAIKEVLGE